MISIHEASMGSTTLVRVLGGVPSSCDVDRLIDVVERACADRPERVVVDLNAVGALEPTVIERLLGCRSGKTDTIVAIDVSRRHGPSLLDMVARLLDPRIDAGSTAC